MKRLTLKFIGEEHLSLTDNRAIRTWCKRHKVEPFKDGKSWYVWEHEFMNALHQPLDKNPENTIFVARPLKRESYKPTSSHALDFERKYGKAA